MDKAEAKRRILDALKRFDEAQRAKNKTASKQPEPKKEKPDE